jgi:protein-L-isoaspartate(D-aspartate) O-methyltransferase
VKQTSPRERDYSYQRRHLVEQLRRKGIADERVLAAIGSVPRHEFVRAHLAGQAYKDFALPLSDGQTISQPYVVARMTELLEVGPTHRVLEIGTGSGYQTAVLAGLARWVFSLERVGDLARRAIQRIRELGYENVKIQIFDGTVGWSEMAPFDRILVTAGAPAAPAPLLEQLAPRGRMVIPEGDRLEQRLVVYEKTPRGNLRRTEGEGVAFVPLVGRHGWRPEEGR